MDRLKGLFVPKKLEVDPREYAPLTEEPHVLEGSVTEEGDTFESEVPFSWLEYSIFALVGVAMLWAWNMFLAAAPYFLGRFTGSEWVSQNFQSAILSVSTITNLTAMVILANMQKSANYAFRINCALIINTCVFALLTISTTLFLDASPGVYLFFLLLMVGAAALATGLIQNGAFAFAASFGRPEYTQAIMAGQGIAGVLPPLAQMLTVLAVPGPPPPPPPGPGQAAQPPPSGHEAGTAAFIYFLTAVAISACALAAFAPLVRRHNHIVENRMVEEHMEASVHSIQEAEQATRHVVGLGALFRKLHWLAGAVFVCFVVAMFFPVFTGKILSVRDDGSPDVGRLFRPPAFIPLAFFFWNLGDLCGRVATAAPAGQRLAADHPAALFLFGVARAGFLPLYLLCNIHGRGAVVSSDAFYLLLVQFPYGLTNGWLASSAMMVAGEWVDEGEREATGGFMGLCLVAGLAAGSLLSFTAAGI